MEKVIEAVFYLAVWACRCRELLVFLNVPGLPYLVKDQPNAARFVGEVAFVELEDFCADVIRGVSEEVTMRALDQAIADVLLEVLFSKRPMQ